VAGEQHPLWTSVEIHSRRPQGSCFVPAGLQDGGRRQSCWGWWDKRHEDWVAFHEILISSCLGAKANMAGPWVDLDLWETQACEAIWRKSSRTSSHCKSLPRSHSFREPDLPPPLQEYEMQSLLYTSLCVSPWPILCNSKQLNQSYTNSENKICSQC
jgi:hypothetical protein